MSLMINLANYLDTTLMMIICSVNVQNSNISQKLRVSVQAAQPRKQAENNRYCGRGSCVML